MQDCAPGMGACSIIYMSIPLLSLAKPQVLGVGQTFQLSRFDRETPSMRQLPPVPRFYIQLLWRANLVLIPTPGLSPLA